MSNVFYHILITRGFIVQIMILSQNWYFKWHCYLLLGGWGVGSRWLLQVFVISSLSGIGKHMLKNEIYILSDWACKFCVFRVCTSVCAVYFILIFKKNLLVCHGILNCKFCMWLNYMWICKKLLLASCIKFILMWQVATIIIVT